MRRKAGVVVALVRGGASPRRAGGGGGRRIPYLPGARRKKTENFEKQGAADREIQVLSAGRATRTYMPLPFQIVQTYEVILIVYELPMPPDIYMGNATPSFLQLSTFFSSTFPFFFPRSTPGWGQSATHLGGRYVVVDVTSFKRPDSGRKGRELP